MGRRRPPALRKALQVRRSHLDIGFHFHPFGTLLAGEDKKDIRAIVHGHMHQTQNRRAPCSWPAMPNGCQRETRLQRSDCCCLNQAKLIAPPSMERPPGKLHASSLSRQLTNTIHPVSDTPVATSVTRRVHLPGRSLNAKSMDDSTLDPVSRENFR